MYIFSIHQVFTTHSLLIHAPTMLNPTNRFGEAMFRYARVAGQPMNLCVAYGSLHSYAPRSLWRTGRMGGFHLCVGAVLTQHGRGWGGIFHLPCWACVNIACRILCSVVLCCVVCCCVLFWVVLCCVVLCCVVRVAFLLCYIVFCCVVFCPVVLCCVVLCCVVLCCVVLCCVVLCCVVLCCVVSCCGTSVKMVHDLLHYPCMPPLP